MICLTQSSYFVISIIRSDVIKNTGEVLFRQEAAGLNFIDVYHRTGLYPLAEASMAHRELENRKTTGSTLLIP